MPEIRKPDKKRGTPNAGVMLSSAQLENAYIETNKVAEIARALNFGTLKSGRNAILLNLNKVTGHATAGRITRLTGSYDDDLIGIRSE